MAHFSDVLKGFFQKPRPDHNDLADGDGQGGDGPSHDVSTLYSLVRAERYPNSRFASYIKHEYEVTVWRSSVLFVAEMRSRLRYSTWEHTIGRPWIYRETFDALAAARDHAAAILADPRRYGDINRDRGTRFYWDQTNRRDEQRAIVSSYERPDGIDDGTLAEAVAGGTVYVRRALFGRGREESLADAIFAAAKLPTNVSAGEIVRQLWARPEPAARAAVLRFAHEATLTYGHWSHWKWLYKRAEEEGDGELLGILIARLDAATPAESASPPFSWLEQTPRAATLAYMKRRARRALRLLAARDPAGYVDVASRVLSAQGPGRRELDPLYNWVSFDILYGGSGRYAQVGHGRGRYVCRRSRPAPTVRDELVPDAWSARPDLLEQLYAGEALPWQTQEWACAMLRRRDLALPALPEATLVRFLESPSPLLIRTAVAAVVSALEAGQQPPPKATALALYRANGSQRRQVLGRFAAMGVLSWWDRDVARELGEVVGLNARGVTLAPRLYDAVMLLGTRYATVVSDDTLLDAIPALLTTGRDELVALARRAIGRMDFQRLLPLLRQGVALGQSQRELLADLLVTEFQGRDIRYYDFYAFVYADDPWVRAVGWRLVAAQPAAARGPLSWLWEQILSRHTSPAVLASAIASADALRLLAPEKLEGLVARLRTEPALVSMLSAESFAFLSRRFPLETTLDVIVGLPSEVWVRVRARFVDELRADGRLDAFWRAIAAPDASPQLAARIADDPVVAASFGEVAAPDYLDRANPLVAPLLFAWMRERSDLFTRGSRPLLLAALNKDPQIRAWALRRAAEVGLTTSFALRLLESGLPETVDAGKAYFDAVPHGAPEELDHALAICDSPDPATQSYGRAYIAARRDTLPRDELIRRLAEHPDPSMQEVVASALLETPVPAVDVQDFDAAVLRGRDRGRRAKELVKRRLASAPAPDLQGEAATLLELARGRTARDKEWALEQLARLALAGETVDGLGVDGVGGI